MAQPLGPPNYSIAAQNVPSSTQDAYQLNLEQVVTELCKEVFAEQSNRDAQEESCFIPGDAYSLRHLLDKDLISTQQRLQVFKIPFCNQKSLKKPFKKEGLIPYCPEHARIIFNEKGEVVQFVKRYQIEKYKLNIFFPKFLPSKYNIPKKDLESIKKKFSDKRKDILWPLNMFALSVVGEQLFPQDHTLFPRINDLLKRMILLMPAQVLKELEQIESETFVPAVETSNQSMDIAQNITVEKPTEDPCPLDLEQTGSELCNDILSETTISFESGAAYSLQELLDKNLINVQQRLQAFKLPLHRMVKWKKPFKEKTMVVYCPKFANVIFNCKGEVINFVNRNQNRRYKIPIIFPNFLPEEYNLSDIPFQKNCIWTKDMYALKVMGEQLFPQSQTRFPKLSNLFQRMVQLSPFRMLNELNDIENSGELYTLGGPKAIYRT